MPLFEIKPLSGTAALGDPSGDYKTARRAEQFRFSANAIYFPAFPGTRYLPFRAVSRAIARNSGMPLKGCCGKELPVTKLRLYYDGEEFYQDFVFEKPASALAVLDALQALCPGTPVDRELGPRRL